LPALAAESFDGPVMLLVGEVFAAAAALPAVEAEVLAAAHARRLRAAV
jgi:hypothetical protein